MSLLYGTADLQTLTRPYTPSKMVMQVFRGTPTLTALREKAIMRLDGESYEPIIEVASDTGAFYDAMDLDSGYTTKSSEIATKAHFEPHFWWQDLVISAQEKILPGRAALVNLVDRKMVNAMEAVRSQYAAKIYTGSEAADPKEVNGLERVVSDTNTCGGINPSDATIWKSVIVEGTSTYSVAVSPSLAQVNHTERELTDANTGGGQDGTGKPNVWIVAPRLWTTYLGQIEQNDYAMAMQAFRGNDFVRWGFDSIFTATGTPIVRDPDCSGAAWETGKSTRATAAGYHAYGLNFEHLKLMITPQRFFSWQEQGWVQPNNQDSFFNRIYVWANIVTDKRKAHAHIYNIDITQDEASWGLTSATIPAQGTP